MKRPCGCAACDRPTDAFVCRPCMRELERELGETGWLLDELETVLTRRAVYGDRYGGSGAGKSTPLVFDVRASDRVRELDQALAAAIRAVRAPRPALLRPSRRNIDAAWNVRHRAAVVAARLVELAHHEDAGRIVDDLRSAYARTRSAIDKPADRWFAGPCWTPLCGRDLYADVGKSVAVCETKRGGCGATYDVQTRRDYLLREADDQLANAATIARAVSWLGAEPLTAARVRKWAERKRITPKAFARCPKHAHDVIPPSTCRACSPLYRVGDARDLLAADTRRKGQ